LVALGAAVFFTVFVAIFPLSFFPFSVVQKND